MEYVRVLFARSRNVEMDNTIIGKTNDVLMVEAGFHRFDLGQPVNYVPAFLDRVVQGTTPASPMDITFQTVSAAVAADSARIPVKADPEPAPARPRRAARPARARSSR
jgi:hypothetical protein